MITLQILFPLAIIKYMKFLIKDQSKFRGFLSLSAYGRGGTSVPSFFLAALFAKQKQNSAAKARAGRGSKQTACRIRNV